MTRSMSVRGRVIRPGIDLRFLARVDDTLLRHPAVVDAGRCPFCRTMAPARAATYRQRRVIETIVAAETETFDRPSYGVVWDLLLPPHIGCGHMNVLPLPLWDTSDGRFYYARHRREWD